MMVLDILIALGVGVLCALCFGAGHKLGRMSK